MACTERNNFYKLNSVDDIHYQHICISFLGVYTHVTFNGRLIPKACMSLAFVVLLRKPM